MSKPSIALTRLVDRLVPAQYHDADPDILRRARLCVLFAGLLAQQAATFIAVYLALGLRSTALWVSIAGCFLLLTPWQLRHSLARGTHHLTGVLVAILIAVATGTGGLQAPAFWWMPVAPVIATMLAGRRAGWTWLGAISLIAAVMTAMTVMGHGWAPTLSPTRVALLAWVAMASLAFVHLGLAALYESTRERMMEAVDQANREMRLVLDNVEQGFVTVDAEGKLSSQRSRALSRWFEEPAVGARLWSWIGRDATFARWLELSWAALFDGMLPVELAAEQIPSRLEVDGRALQLSCRPLPEPDGAMHRALVVITDVTAQAEAERAELAQREMVAVIERASRDRAGFLQFYGEASALVRDLDAASPTVMRAIHTLKGNCALFGVRGVAEQCHALETRVADTGERPSPEDLRALSHTWAQFASRVQSLTRVPDDHVEVSAEDYDAMMEAVVRGADPTELVTLMASWRLERTSLTLGRFAEQARALAARLLRGDLEVVVDDGGVRLDRAQWSPFWSAFVHAVRNAVDHGLESPDERAAAGKREPPTLWLSAALGDDVVRIELADNGRGVDWDAVAARAAERGLAHDSPEALHEALFADGLSTRAEATDVSGRGVGLAALRGACRELDGDVSIRSERGVGTTLTVTVPVRRPRAGSQVALTPSTTRSIRAELAPANEVTPLRRRVSPA